MVPGLGLAKYVDWRDKGYGKINLLERKEI